MKTKFTRALALILSSIIIFCSCAAENPPIQEVDSDVDLNETQTLFVGIKNADENAGINPLFLKEENSDIAYAMNSQLVMTSENGVIVAGEEYPTIASDYTVYFVNDKNEVHAEYQEGDRALYTFLIKPNLMFSNGSKITADDVLFTLYTALDPQYNGSLSISSLPIEGLEQYQKQMTPEIEEEYLEYAQEFLENGEEYEYEDEEISALSNAFWGEIVSTAGEEYCNFAVKYVSEKYLTDEYVKRYLSEDLTAQDVEKSLTLKIAYAMIVWEVGSFNEEGKFVFSDKVVDVKNGGTLSLNDFWKEIYSKHDRDLEKIDDDAAGENTVSSLATSLFVEKYGPLAMDEKINEISGVNLGETLVDGEIIQTVSLTLSDYSPAYLSKMTIPVISKTAYTNGYEYSSDKTKTYGVELDSVQFMAHIRNNTFSQVSSGAYKASVGPLGDFCEDGVWYFVRNDNFKTLGVHNAYIKNVAFVKVSEGEEFSHFEGGFVNATDFIPDIDTAQKIAQNGNIKSIQTGKNSYGYILINPRFYPDLNERIALASLFDTSLALEYYPINTANSLTRSNVRTSFAYPKTSNKDYPYISNDEAVKGLFEKAGYTFETKNDTVIMTDQNGERANFVFTLPSQQDSHPAGNVFKNAVSRLVSLGALAEIAVDENLTQTIYSDTGVAIYAMARKLGDDPDSRHIYSHESVSNITKANGVTWLWENGESDDLGEIEINEKNHTQAEVLDELNEILNDAAYLVDYQEREKLYHDALDIFSKLCIEIPLYQRNSLFVFDKTLIDDSEIDNSSSFLSPIRQVWKLKFFR